MLSVDLRWWQRREPPADPQGPLSGAEHGMAVPCRREGGFPPRGAASSRAGGAAAGCHPPAPPARGGATQSLPLAEGSAGPAEPPCPAAGEAADKVFLGGNPSRFPRSRPGRRRGRLPLSECILEIFAVSQGIVGIRGVFSNKFLAMSKKGKLHASARFTADCQFRERFQENSYNTYASAVHRSPRSGRQWYVALNKRGKAKRGCSPRARPQHVSTHFLPRFRQPQPPELAFTVTLPEKKPPPPPKPKVAPSPPRKNPGPVKYRLKFRFG
uniref:Fibroblast growth factor n=1 Tax=Aquila chrysaetos chrysaetos TaxID=223781 RepID=A0A663DNS2_AQUCH